MQMAQLGSPASQPSKTVTSELEPSRLQREHGKPVMDARLKA